MKSHIAIAGLALVLASCTTHQPTGPASVSYQVPRNFQTVYLRVQHQAQECLALAGNDSFDVMASLNPGMQSATVLVKHRETGAEAARTVVKAIDARQSDVSHWVEGSSRWNTTVLEAMRASVMRDASVCAGQH